MGSTSNDGSHTPAESVGSNQVWCDKETLEPVLDITFCWDVADAVDGAVALETGGSAEAMEVALAVSLEGIVAGSVAPTPEAELAPSTAEAAAPLVTPKADALPFT